MTNEERFKRNHDAYTEISVAKWEMSKDDCENYFDEMLVDILVQPYPTLEQQVN